VRTEAEIQAARAARKAANAEAESAQRVADLDAIDVLEAQNGDANTQVVEVPFDARNPLPCLVLVRAPDETEMKRYRDTVKPRKDGSPGDPLEAARQLASACVIYPPREQYDAICKARTGLSVQLGLAAVNLSVGKVEAEGKG
jgi:hypothetical protein